MKVILRFEFVGIIFIIILGSMLHFTFFGKIIANFFFSKAVGIYLMPLTIVFYSTLIGLFWKKI